MVSTEYLGRMLRSVSLYGPIPDQSVVARYRPHVTSGVPIMGRAALYPGKEWRVPGIGAAARPPRRAAGTYDAGALAPASI
eukprot:CAMPEP_0119496420 /NCGR_PEP_ID=MMETSP1344-20130328/19763_1 /TAXON_ID=236787 /ORGANISM="Florenciella parvula, Strain CCMP2471" /LENGTH=80 /DNA_ID=CAMNT_0007532111 /DNA_START=55 /DNA_END=297 /DNA_ORIENTATION=+